MDKIFIIKRKNILNCLSNILNIELEDEPTPAASLPTLPLPPASGLDSSVEPTAWAAVYMGESGIGRKQ